MSINLGDAVMTFTADLTQLDAAFARVNAQAKAQLTPAGLEAQRLANSLNNAGDSALVAGESLAKAGTEAEATSADVQQLGDQFLGAGEKAVVAGAEMEEAGAKASFSMREAKESAGLLSEAVGVTLPRNVRGFLAELPGVGAALESAFSAVAVYFLIDALIQGAEKLTAFIADTFIFTQKMKDSDEITKKMNADLLQHSEALQKLRDDYALLGLSGIAKTTEQMALLNKQITQNAAAMQAAQAAALGGNAEAQADFNERHAQAGVLQQQLTNLEKEGAQERLAAQKAADAIRLAESKVFADVFAAYDLQAQRLLIANRGQLNSQGSALDAKYHEQLYQNELNQLTKSRDAIQKDANATLAQKEQANKAILDLETKHQTEILQVNADTTNGIRNLLSQRLLPTWELTDDQIKTDALRTAEAVSDAFQKFFGQQDKGFNHTSQLMKIFQKDTKDMASAAKFFGDVGKLAFGGFEQALESAISSAILGQQSFGTALRQGTAEVLANIAAQALVYAAFYLAYGFGKLAEYDFTAATEAFISAAKFGVVGVASGAAAYGINPSQQNSSADAAGASSSASTLPTSAQQPEQQPVQAVNIQHVARGGLFTQRTLAVIGDSSSGGNQREAVLPLGQDDNALNEIADRIWSRNGAAQAVHNWNVHVEGVISADNLHKVFKKASRAVGTGTMRFSASDSRKVTRRG